MKDEKGIPVVEVKLAYRDKRKNEKYHFEQLGMKLTFLRKF